MNPIRDNILLGYAYALWAKGYRAEDRNAIGMLLSISDEDIDFICNKLSEWGTEDEEPEVQEDATN